MAVSTDPFTTLDPQGGATLPLLGYRRLYETQLRSERKSPKTLEAYDYVLGKFEAWFSGAYGRPPTLADLTVIQVRLFLVAAQEKPKWRGHPFLEGRSDKTISGATVHHYVRSLKTFGAWPGS